MPTSRETQGLARSIVLAQGNVFIKELLREHRITLGTTKADFQANMTKAIDDGLLTYEHIEAWLRETEGWGNQHIYLYRIPKKECGDLSRSTDAELKARLQTSGVKVAKLWGADASLEFPESPTLTGIYRLANGDVQFVWHQGAEVWKREPGRDYEEEIDGDQYKFAASRLLARRAVIRCELRPAIGLAGVFLQLPVEEGHESTLAEVRKKVRGLFELSDQRRVSVAQMILGLDQQALPASGAPRSITSRQMQVRAPGGSVTFASAGEGSYSQSAAVRRVRLAVRPKDFTGNRGEFLVPVQDGTAMRDIRVELYAEECRVRVKVQMNRSQVWDLTQYLAGASV